MVDVSIQRAVTKDNAGAYDRCMKTVVVTGAAGFLGSHLAKYHLDHDDAVYGIDNFSSSAHDSKHLNGLKTHERFIFIEADICDNPFVGWNTDTSIDIVYNFACPASPPVYQRMPVETLMTCTQGLKHVLDMAHEFKAKVLHASTSEVYGDPTSSPQREDHLGNVHSYGPRACYDEGKRAAEALCYDYLNEFNVDVRLARIFNTYGPCMAPDDGRVVSNFIVQALRGEKLTVHGTGEQTRSFCYVDDMVRAIVSLGSLQDNPRTPVNIGNPRECTVNVLASKVIEKVHRSTGRWMGDVEVPPFDKMIERKPLPVDDPTRRCPDITLATKLLGWEPMWSLDKGLDATIDYFR